LKAGGKEGRRFVDWQQGSEKYQKEELNVEKRREILLPIWYCTRRFLP
jgi:hypothetical protein